MTTSKLPPFDNNGFYLPNGEPHPSGLYGPAKPPQDDQVETAVAYLSQLKPTKQPTYSSYYLKHRLLSNGAAVTDTVLMFPTVP